MPLIGFPLFGLFKCITFEIIKGKIPSLDKLILIPAGLFTGLLCLYAGIKIVVKGEVDYKTLVLLLAFSLLVICSALYFFLKGCSYPAFSLIVIVDTTLIVWITILQILAREFFSV